MFEFADKDVTVVNLQFLKLQNFWKIYEYIPGIQLSDLCY